MINLLFLIFVTLLATNLAFANDVSTSTVKKPLNVLFILTDDQATDTISAHGNKRISTPNIDRLANAGTSFTHVFNQGSWSPAVCAPSRRMINSGRHIFHTGMGPDNHKQGNDTKDFKMFGETFKDAGYQTFMTGKWHLPMSIFERSFTQGKAIFKSGMARENDGGQWQAAFVDYVPSAKGTNKYLQYKGDKHTSEMVAEAAEPEHATRITTMMAELETWKKRVGDPLDNNDVENSFKMMGGINDKDHRARDWKNKPSH